MGGVDESVGRIPSDRAKKRLALVWFLGSTILFLVILGQSLVGFYGEQTMDAWSWFLPSILPTLTLIIGVLVSDALGKSAEHRLVDRFIFRLSLGLSVIYLLTLSLTIFVVPFTTMTPLGLMKSSQLWLVPFQGLVSAAMGAFFVNRT